MQQVDVQAIIRLKAARHKLTALQYRTLRGQVFAGDSLGAMRGLRKILNRKEAKYESEKRHTAQHCRRE